MLKKIENRIKEGEFGLGGNTGFLSRYYRKIITAPIMGLP